jgi:hypothetical protein
MQDGNLQQVAKQVLGKQGVFDPDSGKIFQRILTPISTINHP